MTTELNKQISCEYISRVDKKIRSIYFKLNSKQSSNSFKNNLTELEKKIIKHKEFVANEK